MRWLRHWGFGICLQEEALLFTVTLGRQFNLPKSLSLHV